MTYPFIWHQFLATFSTLHPSFHPRSILDPPSHHLRPTSPTISPFQLPITLLPTSPPFRVFVLCKWRGEGARSCGEAARQGVKNPKRWDRHWHMQKRKERHTLYIACKTKCLGPPYALQRRRRFWFAPKENYVNERCKWLRTETRRKLIFASKFQEKTSSIEKQAIVVYF